MPLLLIEIHDTGVQAWCPAAGVTDRQPPSPGYARLDGDQILTGAAAAGQARIHPRHLYHRFWSDLDRVPLPPPAPAGLSHADLAHAHLSDVWRPLAPQVSRVLLVVPGSFSDEQLGLLLGMAQAIGLPVRGMVDAAVAASAGRGRAVHRIHLDLQLHRVVATVMTLDGDLARQRVELLDAVGQTVLHDLWARHIAQVSVHRTRFDPLHRAASEQALHDRLPAILHQLIQQQATTVSLSGDRKGHGVSIERTGMVAAAASAYQAMVAWVGRLLPEGAPVALLLSHRITCLPGLVEALDGGLDAAIDPLPPAAALEGAAARQERICSPGETLPFVTVLPEAEPAVAVAPPPPARLQATAPPPARVQVVPPPPPSLSGGHRRRPTHLVHDGIAHPITPEPLVLGRAVDGASRGLTLRGAPAGVLQVHCRVVTREGHVVVEDHSRGESFLNGERIDGSATVGTGDLLRLGRPGIEVQFVEVVRADGTPTD